MKSISKEINQDAFAQYQEREAQNFNTLLVGLILGVFCGFLFGFTALGIGLSLIALIVYAMLFGYR